jgi:hypothetical protein
VKSTTLMPLKVKIAARVASRAIPPVAAPSTVKRRGSAPKSPFG